MKKVLIGVVAAIAALVFVPSTLTAGEFNDLDFRFLWPDASGGSGTELVGLKEENAGSSTLSLSLPSGGVVAESKLRKLEDNVYVFETEIKKEIATPTGDWYKPHFAMPAISTPDTHKRVLTYEVKSWSPSTDKAVPTNGPIILYSDALEVMIISPLDNFMEAMTAPVDGEWHSGFGGLIEKIPAGTVHKVLVVTGHGINDTMFKWGDIIRKWHNHERTDPYAGLGISHLGYYTDNGAIYYYKTAPDMNYHQTLMAVKDDADRRDIPFGYFQIDSWWYLKANKRKNMLSMVTSGTLLWEPMPEYFPQGLTVFREELGLPLVAHNRWYDVNTPYCERYECAPGGGSKDTVLPIEPAFWDEIMDNAVSYGVAVYEQDWLDLHVNRIPWLRNGMGNANLWFDTMVNAADARGLTFQLCMASPEFFFQQMKHDNVTHVRCSTDYVAGLFKSYYWPNFHRTSMFANAVGIWPFKDVFQSASGQRTIRNERWPFEEALISNLSGGPVGPSDAIGAADRELLMRTCRKDGMLLKPDRPALPIDLMFLEHHKPWIVTTQSANGIGETMYLAAFNVWPLRTFDLEVSFSDLGISGEYLLYNWREREFVTGSDKVVFGRMPKNDAFYYVLCPVLENGMALIGESEKFVTLSKKRFPSIKLEEGALKMEVQGEVGEPVDILVYSDQALEVDGAMVSKSSIPNVSKVSITIPDSGRTYLRVK
jgi:hypothetical protein